MTAGFDTDGSTGTAGRNYRVDVPAPRTPTEAADHEEPGRRRTYPSSPAKESK
jgi:hypothetical protein